MVAVPLATPVPTPVEATTVAIPVLRLVQVPPVVSELKVVVEPTHTDAVPVMAAACSQMVTGAAVFHKSLASATPLALTALIRP